MDRGQGSMNPYAGPGLGLGPGGNHQGLPQQQLPLSGIQQPAGAMGGIPHAHMQYLQSPQHPQQHTLQQEKLQQLQAFWQQQMTSIEQVQDFKSHTLPLARIKKIMKSDEDVRMISSEAPALFAKACEMFILELTLRSWNHAEENKRRTLQKDDIAAALNTVEVFDFLVDVVPQTDVKDSSIQGTANAGLMGRQPVPGEMLGYYPVNPQAPQMGTAVGSMDPMMYQNQVRAGMK